MRLMLAILAAAILASQPTMAREISCKDAAAFYYYTMFAGKLVSKISGVCAKDLSQPACVAFLSAMMDSDGDLKKVKQGNMDEHLLYLKERCPEEIPDNPGKF